MTTIAYRDGILAGDTLRTSNGMRDGFTRKVHKIGRLLIAACGTAALCAEFRSWVVAGLNGPSPFNDKKGDEGGNGLVIMPDGLAVIWGSSGPWALKQVPFVAMGSGEQVAMGAMAMGASAEQAVAAAMSLDTGSGGAVQSVQL